MKSITVVLLISLCLALVKAQDCDNDPNANLANGVCQCNFNFYVGSNGMCTDVPLPTTTTPSNNPFVDLMELLTRPVSQLLLGGWRCQKV